VQPLESTDPAMIGGYPLLARLGAGGMGQVYLSRTPTGRPLAIKTVRPDLTAAPTSPPPRTSSRALPGRSAPATESAPRGPFR
jgi:serine/threonine protein kinase